MAARRNSEPESQPRRRRPPATTPEGRENQLINLAFELAEKQIREGNVSAQVLSHYLKLGSSRERLEQERLKAENEMLQTKIKALESAQNAEALYTKALDAMRSYSGQAPVHSMDEYDD